MEVRRSARIGSKERGGASIGSLSSGSSSVGNEDPHDELWNVQMDGGREDWSELVEIGEADRGVGSGGKRGEDRTTVVGARGRPGGRESLHGKELSGRKIGDGGIQRAGVEVMGARRKTCFK